MSEEAVEAVVAAPEQAQTKEAVVQAPEAAQPEAKQADVKTIADGGSSEDGGAVVQAKWPDNWRDEMAGDDEALKKELSKLNTPADVARRIREQQKLISSGGHRKPPSKDATPEQVAAWRKANDVPEAPKGYSTDLPDGLTIGEFDKPVVEDYLNLAHSLNIPNEMVKQNLAWYFATQEKVAFDNLEKNSAFKKDAEDILRQEWGGDYRMNVNMIPSVFSTAPDGLYEKIAQARTPDGLTLGNDPDMNRWLVRMARELNPDAAVMPHIHGDRGQAISDEMSTIKAKMGDHSSEYWRGDRDSNGETKMQRRYRELTEATEKLSKK